MKKCRKKSLFQNLRCLTTAAMLTAISVVIGIFCKNFLNFGNGLFRVTFENLPIILSGLLFGPAVGGCVGMATDIVSYLMSSQAFPLNPLVTLGAGAVGLVSGFVARYIIPKKGTPRIILAALAGHLVGSMILKPIGLYQFYGLLVLWRIPLYLLIAPIEIVLLCLLFRNHSFQKMLAPFDANQKSTHQRKDQP